MPAAAADGRLVIGDERPIDNQRAILRRAFDRGVTHFDLANNYGPP
jgi:L-glyceraldehyde 3-phosphate reductase